MTQRRFILLLLSAPFVVALMVAVAPAQVVLDPSAPRVEKSEQADPDVWPDEAVSDQEAARQGRAALPFTQEQIELLGRLADQTRRAAALAAGTPAAGRVRYLRLSGRADDGVPLVVTRKGYTTVLSFVDMTGAPWPIEEVHVTKPFLAGRDAERTVEEHRESLHLLYLTPQRAWVHGNAVVKLRGLTEPVVVRLEENEGEADFRLDIRMAAAGPNADPRALVQPVEFHAGDDVLLGLLTGAVPSAARRLAVRGGGPEDRAWQLGADLLLLTPSHLLSPGPWAAERGMGGRWAYRLPETPYALVSDRGRKLRLSFGDGRNGQSTGGIVDED